MACAELTLDQEVIALQRMVLQEAGKFSDIAGRSTKTESAHCRCVGGLLRVQQKRGLGSISTTSTRPPECCLEWSLRAAARSDVRRRACRRCPQIERECAAKGKAISGGVLANALVLWKPELMDGGTLVKPTSNVDNATWLRFPEVSGLFSHALSVSRIQEKDAYREA